MTSEKAKILGSVDGERVSEQGTQSMRAPSMKKAREELARAAWEGTRIWNPKDYTSLQVMKKW